MNIITVDFDETLYDNERGIIINKDKINSLFEEPFNFIVVYTARSYSQFFFIKNILDKADVKYHAIVCEKLRADKMIDDKNAGGLVW